jgi:CubicO group peptidase (beta-lactamase class C family)
LPTATGSSDATAVERIESSSRGERRADWRDELDAVLAEYLDRNDVPGVALSVFDESELVHTVALGIASVEEPKRELTAETCFRVYSVAKPFMGTVASLLAESEELDLDAPVDAYLPGFAVSGKRDSGGITLRHLLSHRSGLPHGPRIVDGAGRPPRPLADYVYSEPKRHPPLAAPGVLFSYSNLGAAVAGHVLERVTGSPFASIIQERLFEPLAMSVTTYDPTVAMTHELAQHHLMSSSGRLEIDHRGRGTTEFEPSSGCFTNIIDLARFGMLHLAGGLGPQGRLLPTVAIDRMHMPLADLHLDVNLRYGTTFYVGPAFRGHDRIFHEGLSDGMWATLVLAPGERIGVAWCDNRGHELGQARYEALERALSIVGCGPGEWERGRTTGDSLPDFGRLVGRYSRGGQGRPVEIEARDRGLRVRVGNHSVPLRPVTPNVWVDASPTSTSPPPVGALKPHAASGLVSVGFVIDGAGGAATHVLLNGAGFPRATRD